MIPWVYHEAFGHVVEAIEVANNYKTANPNSRVCVVLANASTARLIDYCPWIDHAYLINVNEEIVPQFAKIPTKWDNVVYPLRLSYQPEYWYTPRLLDINRRLQRYLEPQQGSQFDDGDLLSGVRVPTRKYAPIQIKLPDDAVKWAELQRDGKSGPVVSLLLNGSAPVSAFPSPQVWQRLLKHVSIQFPNAAYWLTGMSQETRYGMLTARQRNLAIARFANSTPQLNNYYDIGLERQLALIATSDVFIAPHTGFSFLAPCVGTPWLALSGGSWGDCTVGNTPFYFSVPPCDCYPCYGKRKLICRIHDRFGTTVPCTGSMLIRRVGDVVRGIEQLLDPGFDLHQSFLAYRSRAHEQSVNVSGLWRLNRYFGELSANTEVIE